MPPGEEHPDAQDVLDLSEAAGLLLDGWQQDWIRDSMRRRDGKWAAFEIAGVLPRQNGKNGTLEARQLGGLYVLRRRLQIHSSHQVDTSLEAFRRLKFLIESNDWLMSEVKNLRQTNGQEEIELKASATTSFAAGGLHRSHTCRIRFRTRTKGGGRGFSADDVYFDEAMIFPEVSLGAIMPVVSAREDPQLWYTGSSVDQLIHEDGFVLARLRARALKGGDPSLAYFEWSAEGESPEDVSNDVATDPEVWAQANPALGIRISAEHVANEQRSMDHRTFAVERLGVGDWPDLSGDGSVISVAKWLSLVDADSTLAGKPIFAVDVSPSRARATIAAAGFREDGLRHVETVETASGTGWITTKLKDLQEKHSPAAIVCDSAGPVASLVAELEQAGVEITTVNSTEHGQACGMLFDAVDQGTLRHLGTPEMTSAIKGAAQRQLGEAWAWSRKNSSVDITPLVASTLAHWAISKHVEGEILVAFR